MDPAVFEEWMMIVLVTVLIAFMGFIVWDLAKKSKAGRFGTLILFFVLGLGVLAFIIKSVVVGFLEGVESRVKPAPHSWSVLAPR
jgi:ABC-type lipoprotein release transport system permease subunit